MRLRIGIGTGIGIGIGPLLLLLGTLAASQAQAQTSPSPAPSTAADRRWMGVNINGVSDIFGDNWSADAVRSARQCAPNDGQKTYGGYSVNLDANFRPTSDFVLCMGSSAAIPGTKSPLTPGLYTCRTTGTFKPTFGDPAQLQSCVGLGSDGRTVFDPQTGYSTFTFVVSPTAANLNLFLFDTKRTTTSPINSGLLDIQVMRPTASGSMQSHDFGEAFYRPMVAFCKQFKTIRYLDALDTNSYPYAPAPQTWAGRMPARRLTHNTGGVVVNGQQIDNVCYFPDGSSVFYYGQPWERIAQFANATDTDLWITLTSNYDSAYLTKLFTGLKNGWDALGEPYPSPVANPVWAGLKPSLKVYGESDNETWNYSFRQFSRLDQLARDAIAQGPSNSLVYDGVTDQQVIHRRVVAKHVVEMHDAAQAVYGADLATRYRQVYMSHQADPTSLSDPLEWIRRWYGNIDGNHVATPRKVGEIIDVAGCGGYFQPIDSGGNNPATPANLDAMFASGVGDLKLENSIAVAKSYGINQFTPYESIWTVGNGVPTPIAIAGQRDARSGPVWDAAIRRAVGLGSNSLNLYMTCRETFNIFDTVDDLSWGIAQTTLTNAANKPSINLLGNFAASTSVSGGGGVKSPGFVLSRTYQTVPDPVGYFRASFFGQQSVPGPAIDIFVDGNLAGSIELPSFCSGAAVPVGFAVPTGRHVVSFQVRFGVSATLSFQQDCTLEYQSTPFQVRTWTPFPLSLSYPPNGTVLANSDWPDLAGQGNLLSTGSGFRADPASGTGFREVIHGYGSGPAIPSPDYAVSADFTFDGVANAQRILVMGRIKPGADFGLGAGNDYNQPLILGHQAGDPLAQGQSAITPVVGKRTYRIEFVGSRVTELIDGFVICSGTLPSGAHAEAGIAGIELGQSVPAGSPGTTVSNFRVELAGPMATAGGSPTPNPGLPQTLIEILRRFQVRHKIKR